MSIEHIFQGREVWCPTCGEWTRPDEWDEATDFNDDYYVEHSTCGYVNGPLDGPLDSRPL